MRSRPSRQKLGTGNSASSIRCLRKCRLLAPNMLGCHLPMAAPPGESPLFRAGTPGKEYKDVGFLGSAQHATNGNVDGQLDAGYVFLLLRTCWRTDS